MKNNFIILSIVFFSLYSQAHNITEINGLFIHTKEELHSQIANDLHFKKYYGHNLDALFDYLTNNIHIETTMTIKNTELLMLNLGIEYTQNFLNTLKEVARVNSLIHIVIIK